MQALVLLNDVQFVEAARALAAEVSTTPTPQALTASAVNTPEPQIQEAFLRATARRPTDEELNLLSDIYHDQRDLFRDPAKQDPAKLLALGEDQTDSHLDPADFAALTVTCQAILNLDATVYER